MPTGPEFRLIADRLDSMSIEAAQAVAPLVGFDRSGAVRGGRLADTIDLAIDATESNIRAAVRSFHDLATECRARAVVCDQYASEMSSYRNAMFRYEVESRAATTASDVARLRRPPRPASPPSWVTPEFA